MVSPNGDLQIHSADEAWRCSATTRGAAHIRGAPPRSQPPSTPHRTRLAASNHSTAEPGTSSTAPSATPPSAMAVAPGLHSITWSPHHLHATACGPAVPRHPRHGLGPPPLGMRPRRRRLHKGLNRPWSVGPETLPTLPPWARSPAPGRATRRPVPPTSTRHRGTHTHSVGGKALSQLNMMMTAWWRGSAPT